MQRSNGSLRISLIQSKRPKDGTLTLEFSDSPLSLRNMIVTDSGGQTTTVSLNNARFNAPIAADLFVFNDPHLGKKQSIQGR
jgi:outer membrane lipoprotein-sorting protein